MDNEGLNRLIQIRRKNADPNWINTDLYRFFYKKDIYVLAYKNLKITKKPFIKSFTPQILKELGVEEIETLIDILRKDAFEFEPTHPVKTPTRKQASYTSLRRLHLRNRLVQEVMRMILTSVYDPFFNEINEKCRTHKPSHSALQQVVREFNGVKWIIEGNTQRAYENFDEGFLLITLRKRIKDERFLKLINKALKSRRLDQKDSVFYDHNTLSNDILSPILMNIYLHELDSFVDNLTHIFEWNVKKSKVEGQSKYNNLTTAISVLEDNSKKCFHPEDYKILLRTLKRKKREESFVKVCWKEVKPVQIRYVRYQGDWVIGINGPKNLVDILKVSVANFLSEKLKLKLSSEKVKVIDLKKSNSIFLGHEIKLVSMQKSSDLKLISDKTYYKRGAGNYVELDVPIQAVIARLATKGFCTGEGVPISKTNWTVKKDPEIISAFNRVSTDLMMYYSIVSNRCKLTRLRYILRYSCLRTLCHKHKLTIKKAYSFYKEQL